MSAQPLSEDEADDAELPDIAPKDVYQPSYRVLWFPVVSRHPTVAAPLIFPTVVAVGGWLLLLLFFAGGERQCCEKRKLVDVVASTGTE